MARLLRSKFVLRASGGARSALSVVLVFLAAGVGVYFLLTKVFGAEVMAAWWPSGGAWG